MFKQGEHLYEFGPFRVDPVERLLTQENRPVPITPRAFEALLLLLCHSGHVVGKDELIKAIWGDSFVEEGNLAVTISMIRKALGEDGDHKYVQTISKRGYRFVEEVREVTCLQAPPASPREAARPEPAPVRPIPSRNRLFVGLAAAVLVMIGLSIGIGILRTGASAGSQDVQSLAVLPFRNLSTGAGHDYLGIGIADTLITKLAGTGHIIVRPTSAVLKYVDSPSDSLAAGREQGVGTILEGRIQTFPGRIRVTAQLMRVADGVSLWGGIFEENSDRVLTLEDALAEKIADAIAPHFSAEGRKRLARRDTENDKAHQLYLQGRYFWNRRTEDGLRRSIRYFQQAIVEDPNSAAAYAGLADAYVLLSPFSVESVRQASPEAKAAARKAVQLDDSLAEAHASMAIISFFYDWKWHEAEQEFRHAISLNQNYAMAHQWYGLNLAAMGRLDEALDQMRRAEELDPLSLIIKTNVGWIYYLRHDYDDATAAYRRALDQDPYFARARTRLGITYIQKHAFADAIRELEESERLAGSDPYVDGLLGYAHALAGDNQAGRRTLNELKERSRREYVPPFSVALLCLALGDQDRGLDWLGRAYGDHDTSMVYAATDPSLDSVRSDARFRDLLVRMRF